MPPNQSGEIAGQPSNLANSKVGPADFVLLRVVGQGAFGKVLLIYFTSRSNVYQNLLYIPKRLATHNSKKKVCCSGETRRPLHIPSSS